VYRGGRILYSDSGGAASWKWRTSLSSVLSLPVVQMWILRVLGDSVDGGECPWSEKNVQNENLLWEFEIKRTSPAKNNPSIFVGQTWTSSFLLGAGF